jgi:hypothetical protein
LEGVLSEIDRINEIGSTIGGPLVGGGLAKLMGSRLRAILDFREAPEEPGGGRSVAARFTSAIAQSEGERSASGSLLIPSRSGESKEPLGDHGVPDSSAQVEHRQAGRSPNDPEASRPGPVFVKLLREYMQVSGMDSGTATDPRSIPPAWGSLGPWNGHRSSETKVGGEVTPGDSNAWFPQMTDEDIARELQVFADDTSSGFRADPPPSVPSARQNGESGISGPFGVSTAGCGTGSGESTADLAGKMAGILREQALRHGIDIT